MPWNDFPGKSSPMPICLDGSVCVLWAVLLLTLPLPWVLGAILAGAFHEFCHLAALILTGTTVYSIRIGFRGAKIETGSMDPRIEFICAAAGPAGSLFLLLFLRQIPRIALCAAVQGIFNLLPWYPMDGGRILRSLRAAVSDCQEKYLAKKRISLYNSATKRK